MGGPHSCGHENVDVPSQQIRRLPSEYPGTVSAGGFDETAGVDHQNGVAHGADHVQRQFRADTGVVGHDQRSDLRRSSIRAASAAASVRRDIPSLASMLDT